MKRMAIVLLLFCCSLLSCGGGAPATQEKKSDRKISVDEEPDGKPRNRAASRKPAAKLPSLSLDFLFNAKKAAESAPDASRNLSSMEEDPAVVAERKKKEEEARKQAEEAAKKTEEERKKHEEEVAKNPPPPEPPPINFEFIGYMGPGSGKIGIFKMGGQDDKLVLAKKGDHIGKEFIVVAVSYESAEIGFKDFKETKTIPLISGSGGK
jgi:hypothetical protein